MSDTTFDSALQVLILGSGTSAGVPMIGCTCEVCTSTDSRNKRTRPSIVVQYGGKNILVDTTPELRLQVIANGINRVDAVVYTHAHADHIFGMDDVRRFNTIIKGPLPMYATQTTFEALQRAFAYAFKPQERTADALYRPELLPQIIDGAFDVLGKQWTPIPLVHGKVLVNGYRIGNFAYCTDCNEIPAASRDMLRGLDVLIIDALRPKPHPTHLSYEQALAIIEDLKPRRAFFTHLSHDMGHEEIEANLPAHVRAAYDGMRIDVR